MWISKRHLWEFVENIAFAANLRKSLEICSDIRTQNMTQMCCKCSQFVDICNLQFSPRHRSLLFEQYYVPLVFFIRDLNGFECSNSFYCWIQNRCFQNAAKQIHSFNALKVYFLSHCNSEYFEIFSSNSASLKLSLNAEYLFCRDIFHFTLITFNCVHETSKTLATRGCSGCNLTVRSNNNYLAHCCRSAASCRRFISSWFIAANVRHSRFTSEHAQTDLSNSSKRFMSIISLANDTTNDNSTLKLSRTHFDFNFQLDNMWSNI